METAALIRQAWQLIEPDLRDIGYELIEVEYTRQGGAVLLRLFIDKEGGGISLDDCTRATHALNPLLDEADFIQGRYLLEVSSPGLTSPFKVKEQYIKSIDKPVDVLLKDGEKLRGTIKNVYNNGIELEIQQVAKALGKKKPTETKEIVSINFDTIKHTKLVLTF